MRVALNNADGEIELDVGHHVLVRPFVIVLARLARPQVYRYRYGPGAKFFPLVFAFAHAGYQEQPRPDRHVACCVSRWKPRCKAASIPRLAL